MDATATRTPDVQAAVARAWRRVLGRPALAENRPFGPDADPALVRLRLVFHLERALGRPLPLDAFRDARRPSEFAAALAGLAEGCGRAPDLILLPGMGGDDNHLLYFRAGLPRSIEVAVLRYPDWPEAAASGRDFDALSEDAVAQIGRLAPEGAVRLAGFSVGGHIAYAAARRLQAGGREVARLGLIDSPRAAVALGAAPRWSARLAGFLAMARQGRSMESACHFTVRAIRRLRPGLIGPLIARRPDLPLDFGFYLRRAMIMDLQMRRLSPWLDETNAHPVPLDVDAVLFRSQEHPTDAAADLGWRRSLPRLRVVPLQGSHTGIFAAGHIADFQAVFLAEMGLADPP